MTAPNSAAVQRCIATAIQEAGVSAREIDGINGHLTATAKDPVEIKNWSLALERSGADFPLVNSFKSTIGHCLAAAGSLECVGTVLQFKDQRFYGNVNTEDLHPEIENTVARSCIPESSVNFSPKILAKASFGFGDVNACVIFRAFDD